MLQFSPYSSFFNFPSRSLKAGSSLPFLQMHVSEKGVKIAATPQNMNPDFEPGPFAIDAISYGVQDLVYTRVFAMIVVRDATDPAPARGAVTPSGNSRGHHPFECFAYVCDSRQNARRLTFALAKAFQEFSKTVKTADGKVSKRKPKQFAIDLRTPEQIEEDMNEEETEA